MVRLKVLAEACIPPVPIFQFLMVRLKEVQRYIGRESTRISIPYGSIKRQKPIKIYFQF